MTLKTSQRKLPGKRLSRLAPSGKLNRADKTLEGDSC
jgi:hypothetical protein